MKMLASLVSGLAEPCPPLNIHDNQKIMVWYIISYITHLTKKQQLERDLRVGYYSPMQENDRD